MAKNCALLLRTNLMQGAQKQREPWAKLRYQCHKWLRKPKLHRVPFFVDGGPEDKYNNTGTHA